MHLEGAVRQTSTNGAGASVIGSVPAVDHSGYDVYEIVATNDGTYADIDITAAGQIELIGPRYPMIEDYSFVSLEGSAMRSHTRQAPASS